ncbi:THUMP domain-containing protein 1 [Neocloeon triangulifer]|uniref:THUMP domain-containing protein 1 n=1 Tax=Neocloeon triangulifer TaxID=2078957 RepID=UPI00286F9E13|nr:THUMP domain-containing protein 1 [Neocloeon triangulifer]
MSYQNKRRGGGYHQKQGGNRFYGGPSRRAHLEVGQRGFLCTCNNYEKECTKEAMNLLNEYADKLFGQEDWRQNASVQETPTVEGVEAQKEEVEEEDEEDISKTLKKEIDELKQESRKPVSQQRFRAVDSGAKNLIFISSNVPDPVLLAHTLLTDLKTSGIGRSRFLQRLLPVQVTCKANLDDISKAASPLFDKYFAEGNKTFSIIYKCRNNSAMTRDPVIETLANLVSLKNASNHANLSQPQLVVLVEIIRGLCCISVLPEYLELAKYNLLEVVAPPKTDKKENPADGAGGSIDEPEEETAKESSPQVDDVSPAKQAKET